MIHEGNIYAGTFDEFKRFLSDRIYEDCLNKRHSDFKGYDFAFLPWAKVGVDDDANRLYKEAEGWFGVKALESPFNDSSNRQFISDYYGGGDFGMCNIFLDDVEPEYVSREVDKMISMTTCSHGDCVWEELK